MNVETGTDPRAMPCRNAAKLGYPSATRNALPLKSGP